MKYAAADQPMLYACACDKLQWCIAEKLSKAEAICADRYPLMRQLQDLLREEAPLDLSRNAIEASMAQPAVLNSLPQIILKRLPKEKLRSLSSDMFFVLQMLVCVEIPSTRLEELPGPLRAEALAQKVQLCRETYLQESHADQGFTAEGVKASLRALASSHRARDRWLRMMLGMKGNQALEERLHEVTDTFFENVTAFNPGYTPGCVATAALVYQLAPATKVRQGPMLLSPAVRLLANSRGEGG